MFLLLGLSTLPSPDNKNPLKTPKKDFHLNTDLKESFLTPRQTKIVSSDEESDNESDIEQQISTKIENTTNSSHEKNDSDGLEHNFADVMGKLKQADPDIIDVSSDEEEVSYIFSSDIDCFIHKKFKVVLKCCLVKICLT